MNYRLVEKKSIHSIPQMIMGQINRYMIDNNHRITPAKLIDLMSDYLKVVGALFNNNKTEIKIAQQELRNRVQTYTASLFLEDEGTIMLSKYPRIELEYRFLDNIAIVYRLVFLESVANTDWVTVNASIRSETVNRVAKRVTDLLYRILSNDLESDDEHN